MKLVDSLNPATQAENIKKLNAGLEAVDAKTPKDYSTTETATGQKWIDGKDIYKIVFTGTTVPTGTSTLPLDFDTLIEVNGYVINTQSLWVGANSNLSIYGDKVEGGLRYTVTTTTVSRPYYIVAIYTKPAPAPETRDDDTKEDLKRNENNKAIETKTTEKNTTLVKETKTKKKTTK